jgi:hypothetical protein
VRSRPSSTGAPDRASSRLRIVNLRSRLQTNCGLFPYARRLGTKWPPVPGTAGIADQRPASPRVLDDGRRRLTSRRSLVGAQHRPSSRSTTQSRLPTLAEAAGSRCGGLAQAEVKHFAQPTLGQLLRRADEPWIAPIDCHAVEWQSLRPELGSGSPRPLRDVSRSRA